MIVRIMSFNKFSIYEDDPLIINENTCYKINFNYYGGH